MGSFIRGAVSKKKRRYQKNGFDLDVTPRIVAMGFPSENVEAAFRNPMKEVLRFLDSFHKDHYRVYNLCSERGYDHDKFYNRVGVYPFDDHNAPPFEMILQFCRDVEQWLQQDEKNIAVIHCKAGKGRTGLMISAWMVYSREWPTAKDALTFYAAMRTYNQKGVTIPSQIRYVHYFEESLRTPVDTKTLLLNKITFYTIPKVAHIPDVNFHVHVGKTLVFTYKDFEDKQRIKDEAKKKTKKKGEDEEEETVSFDCGNVPLHGDVKVEFSEKSSKLFAFWFCSSFVKENRLTLKKEELDKAHKDSSHKSYHQNFRIELTFSELTNSDQPVLSSVTDTTVPVSLSSSASASGSGESTSLSSTSSASPASSPSEPNGLNNTAESDDTEKPLTDQSPGVPLSSVLTGEWVLNKDVLPEEDTAEPEAPNEFAEKLLALLLKACKVGVRGGWLLDTHTYLVRASPVFREFQQLVPRLAKVLLTGLPPYSAIAFWLNVHNMLMVHARVLLADTPKKKEGVLALHQTARYRVGGRVYSGSDMEVGVLRAACNTTNESPFVGIAFAFDDARRVYQLLQHEPRIVFALYRGTESCPPVRVYSHNSLIEDLDAAAKRFLDAEGFSDIQHKDVWLPKLLSWYRMEFGPKDLGLKEVAKKTMPVPVPDFSLKYNQFTWEFKMLPWYVEEEREKAEKLEKEKREQIERDLQQDREKRLKRDRRHTNSHRKEAEASTGKHDRDREHKKEKRTSKEDEKEKRASKEDEKEKNRDRRDKEKDRDRHDKPADKDKRDKENDKENHKEKRREKPKELEREISKKSIDSERHRRQKRHTISIPKSKSEDQDSHRDKHSHREHHKEDREHKERKDKDRERDREKDKDKGKDKDRRETSRTHRAKEVGDGAKDSRRMSL